MKKTILRLSKYFSKKGTYVHNNTEILEFNEDFPLKSSEAYFKELSELKKSFDVNSLKMGTEYVWPYLRNRLWIQLYGLGNGNIKRRDLSHTAIHRGGPKDLLYKHRKRLIATYGAVELENINIGDEPLDFLFVTVINAAEQVVLEDGQIYHRITDPFYELAQKVGNAQKVEFLRVKTKSVEKSKNYYHKVLYILSPTIYKSGFIAKIKFGNLLSQLKKRVPSLVHSGEKLRASIDWEFHTRDFYIDVLRKLKPKVIFLNGFHFQTPLISAADYLGIITVDIQHGIQVGWNPLYNDWKEMPKEGYQGLPNYFWVWGQKEFNSIKKRFKGAKHSPTIVGSPWLDRQLELTTGLKENYVKKFDKYKVKILLALQKQPEVPKIYRELIKNSPKDFLWIIRHHPKGNRFNIHDFGESNQKNVLIDPYMDQITLPHLFQHVNVVISEGSSVASEADYAGVYNFIFSKKGRGNYINEIAKGHFFFIRNYKDFYVKIETLDMAKKVARAKLFEKVNTEEVFRKLLLEYGEKNEK